jgi:hypothetical protein
MPDVCSPMLEQPGAPAPQELEQEAAVKAPGGKLPHKSRWRAAPP